MTWVRLDDNMPMHPKILEVGHDAAWLHVCGIAYCSRLLTDGRIPSAAVSMLGGPVKALPKLLAAGLWQQDGSDYVVVGYLDWNPSRADVERKRDDRAEAKRMAGQRGNHRRWHVERGKPDPDCPLCIAERSHGAIANGSHAATDLRSQNDRTGVSPHPIPSHPISSSLQQHSRSQAPAIAAAAAEVVARRRDLPRLAATKERPQRWLDAAVAGIERDLTAHPEFGRLMHDGADPETFADLLEPGRPLAIVPHEPDPDRPLGSTA